MDLTREDAGDRLAGFVHEGEIPTSQIAAYKVWTHRDLVGLWSGSRGLDPTRVWRAREECIAALAG